MKTYEVTMKAPPGIYPAWGVTPVTRVSPSDGSLEQAMQHARDTFPRAIITEVWLVNVLSERLSLVFPV